MGAPAQKADPLERSLDEAEATFVREQVELAVAPFVGQLSEEDLAWMRARLTESVRRDRRLMELARAGMPREVERSAEVTRTAGPSEDDDDG